MDKAQFEAFLEDNRRSTAEAIEKTVNGKIRAIHNLLEEQNRISLDFRENVLEFKETVEKHIDTVEPYIVGVESTKLVASWVGKALMWIGGFVLTVGGAWYFIKSKF